MKNIIAVTVLLFIGLLFSCKHYLPPPNPGGGPVGPTTPCDANTIYFQQQVLPILLSNCTMAGCHDAASHQDGIVLVSYTTVMSTGGVRPGQPGSSKLYEVLLKTDPSDRMPRPPAAPLSQSQIAIIYKWIQQGAKDLSCQAACDATAAATFNGTIKPLLATNCVGCHSGSLPQGGIDLSSYTGVKAKVTDGKLWGSVNFLPGFSAMPKNGQKLSDCELAQLKKWIDSGALNN